MHEAALAVLRIAVDDPHVRARYEAKVFRGGRDECWHWLGAVSTPHGHGRFWIGALPVVEGRRRGLVVIAHRFGWAIVYGVDALVRSPMLTHACDEPSCQNPGHLVPGTAWSNHHEWMTRRWRPGSPLRDVRGPAGRARAIRTTLTSVGPDQLPQTRHDGLSALDQDQLTLW